MCGENADQSMLTLSWYIYGENYAFHFAVARSGFLSLSLFTFNTTSHIWSKKYIFPFPL